MISPVSLYNGAKTSPAFVSKNVKHKPSEVPAKSPVKEVPANNNISYNIKFNN
jgi:hypothetical protein